jgi:hypothetical protein
MRSNDEPPPGKPNIWRTPARAKAWAKACTIVICDVVFKMITVNFKK